MKKVFTITLIIFFYFYSAQAQTGIKGIIKSENTKEILPYVNIGIIGKGVGTVSNDNGKFEISISKKHLRDSLKISMIGYISQTYLVKDFIRIIEKDNIVYLQENIEEMTTQKDIL